MINEQSLPAAARAAEQAAARFAERGQTDEAAISQRMADRYTRQLTDKEN